MPLTTDHLVYKTAGKNTARRLLPGYEAAGVHPVFFVWESGSRRLPPRSQSRGAAALLAAGLLLFLAGCASQKTNGFTSDLTATKIVKQNADDAFVTHLTAQDLPALTQFKDQIATAHTRADLVTAWKAIPALDAKGSDFLERRVFTKSLDDGDWPPGKTPTELEPAFVAGVKQAAADSIARGGR